MVQRPVLYLGEINSSQERAWRKSIEVFDEREGTSQSLALFPEDRCEDLATDVSVVRLRLSRCGCVGRASGRVLAGAEVAAGVGAGRLLGRASLKKQK